MEKITENNYEVFLLDFIEGRLNNDQERQVRGFISAHPELFSDWKEGEPLPYLKANDQEVLKKEGFYKKGPRFATISDETEDTAMIAWWEEDLTEEEKLALQRFITGKEEKKKKWETYGRLRLAPDMRQVYSRKRQLRKGNIPVVTLPAKQLIAIAAVFLLLVMLVPFARFMVNNTRNRTTTDEFRVQQVAPPQEQSNLNDQEESTGTGSPMVAQSERFVTSIAPMEKRENARMDTLKERKQEVSFTREAPLHYRAEALFAGLNTENKGQLIIPPDRINAYSGNKIYLPAGQWLAYKIKAGVLDEKDTRPGERLTAADFLSLGVKGINAITGWNMRTEQKRDTTSGKTTLLAVTSGIFGYSRSR